MSQSKNYLLQKIKEARKNIESFKRSSIQNSNTENRQVYWDGKFWGLLEAYCLIFDIDLGEAYRETN